MWTVFIEIFFKNNTPHGEQLGTILIRPLFTAQTRASSLFLVIVINGETLTTGMSLGIEARQYISRDYCSCVRII